MAHGQVTTNVPAELKSAAVGGVVASAEGIFDYNENKTQEQLNQDLKKAIEDIDVTEQISGKLDKTEADYLYQPKGNYLTEHQDISGKANIADVYTKQQVDTALGDKQDILADSEDVVKVIKENRVALNFANKTYNSATFSGLGITYLRKNIVTFEGVEKNVLTQVMVNSANTIYHIQYDYDLNGQTITIPDNCVLKFDGGSLKNGTLSGNFDIDSECTCLYNIHFLNAHIKNVSSKWFDIKENTSCEDVLNTILSISCITCSIRHYQFPLVVTAPVNRDSYNQRTAIYINEGNKNIDFNGNTVKLSTNHYSNYNIFQIADASNITISNLTVVGDKEEHTTINPEGADELGHGLKILSGNNITLVNCEFNECWGDGIDIIYRDSDYPTNIDIQNTRCLRNRRNGCSIEGGRYIKFTDCEFAYTGSNNIGTVPMAGIDIEPYYTEHTESCRVVGVEFFNCNIHDNEGNEFQTSINSGDDGYNIYDISLNSCAIYSTKNIKRLVQLLYTVDAKFENCIIGTPNKNGHIHAYRTKNLHIYNSNVYGKIYSVSTRGTSEEPSSLIIKESSIVRDNEDYTLSQYLNTMYLLTLINYDYVTLEGCNITDNIGAWFRCDNVKSINDAIPRCLVTMNNCNIFDVRYFYTDNTRKTRYSNSDNGSLPICNCYTTIIGCSLNTGSTINPTEGDSGQDIFRNRLNILDSKITNYQSCSIIQSNLSRHNSSEDEGSIIIPDINIKNSALYSDILYAIGLNNNSIKVFVDNLPEKMAIYADMSSYWYYNTLLDRKVGHVGNSDNRPNISANTKIGYGYFNVTTKKPENWDGSKWIETDGASAGVQRSGTKAQRPTGDKIYVGFQYMQVDTTYGTYPIWASEIGSSSPHTVTWVDAKGETV